MDNEAQQDSERQDTMQRIQVGVVGLVAVLLLVSVANFVVQRASDEQSAIEELQAEADGQMPELASEEEPPAEPLAELGITPAPEPETETPELEAMPLEGAGQVVPDLEPDPRLEAPMDREPQ